MADKKTVTAPVADGEGGVMSLTGHLKELRNRIFVVAIVFFVGVVAGLAYASPLTQLLLDMGEKYNYTFITTAPQEKLLQYFRIAIYAGIILATPVGAFQTFRFMQPGLKRREARFFGIALIFGFIMFCVGVAFAYFISLPFMLNYLVNGVGGLDQVMAMNQLANYISFVMMVITIFGCVFEMPLISVILSAVGLVTPELLKKIRGLATVLIFLLAAIITPPDVVSQVMVACPMILLYQVSIWLSAIFRRRKPLPADDEDEEEE